MKQILRLLRMSILLPAIIAIPVFFQAEAASVPVGQSQGQVIYVPIYSHIYAGNHERPFNLTATLSIRNTDPKTAITIMSLEYYDSDGKLIKKYLDAPITIGPMASTRYIIKEADTTGGSGANFIAIWKANSPAHPPLFESVMIGTQLQQGISFTSRGLVLAEITD